jgi:competence protein ComEC
LLIPGDLEQAGERALLAGGGDPEAEALIVAHHGSSGGSGALFLSRVGPRHAVISCGFNNRYGHPRPDVLRRLDESGATVYRTDLDGMVLLEAGREGWKPVPTLDRRRTAAE